MVIYMIPVVSQLFAASSIQANKAVVWNMQTNSKLIHFLCLHSHLKQLADAHTWIMLAGFSVTLEVILTTYTVTTAVFTHQLLKEVKAYFILCDKSSCQNWKIKVFVCALL